MTLKKPADKEALRRMVERALPAAMEDAQMMVQIRDALVEGNEPAALSLLRQYLGLPTARAS